MSTRLATGGRLIDRTRRLSFTFDGRRLTGFAGDTLASALLGAGETLVARSFKYHRPRGIVASGPEEPNALVGIGTGGRYDPDSRATTAELGDGMQAVSHNRWPSLELDIGAVNARFARFMPAGFYYKTFIHPRPFWKHVFEPVIRRAAGLGEAPRETDPDSYEHVYHHADILVVGGGIAGLRAALVAGRAGARVMLVEQTAHWGGRAPVDGATIGGRPADEWIAEALGKLRAMENVTLRTRLVAAGLYDHGFALAHERLPADRPADAPRERLWKIRARRIITATGAIERPLSFACNDVPGVMLASAVRDYVMNWAVSPGDRTVIVTNNDDAYRTALTLLDAGLTVPVVVDARPGGGGPLAGAVRERGVRVETGRAVVKAEGGRHVTGVAIGAQAGEGAALEHISCDVVAMSGGWSPAVHLWCHPGGKLIWDEARAFFRPDPERAPVGADGARCVYAAGAANGALHAGEVLGDADAAAKDAGRDLGLSAPGGPIPAAEAAREAPIRPVWVMPQGARRELRTKMWLDPQNDVKVADIELAQREGYESVEHAKRYTTLGMANDQGKLSNVNGLAVLADARGEPIPQVGTTTFRPPYTPVTFGAIAGEAKGALFQPVRETPMHEWHAANGADFEPVGQWRRPFCYRRGGESREAAIAREITATRSGAGMLDASTLGKILVTGPDAPRFMDMIYTGMMSSLRPGRCRYGLICSENGFLIDDGVVARLDEETFLCHTTTGGADTIHAHMEHWLQTEWWEWRVFILNLTEHYAQIGVVGPKSRALLEKLDGMDLSREALPFMRWAEGTLGGFPVRVFRISFAGELSFELAVPAGQGRALWDRLLEAGAEFGLTPYGTEAMHVMRAEKGFIMIGDETDGTVIPQDLNLDWAISKKKDDFIGKRAQQRPHMADPERWKLVGLETLDGSVLPHAAPALAEGVNENGQPRTQGRVTSTYHSPTLGRGIAMALVHRGPDRMGEVLTFVSGKTRTEARITSPVFYDPEGERQNV